MNSFLYQLPAAASVLDMTDLRTRLRAPATGSALTNPWVALSVVLAGAFMASLDGFIVFVASPAIQHDLRATGAEVQLTVAGYGLMYAVGMITGARLGDIHGRRRIFLLGVAVFTAASAACGAAPTIGVLIGSRLVQGLGAALMFPQVFSMIQVLFPPERRPQAFGALGAVIGISTTIGQLVGGLLISANLAGSGWRPVFYVNVPVGVLTMMLALRLVPESKAPEGRRLDLGGAALLVAALFLLVIPLVEGQQYAWPAWVWLSFAASGICLFAFVMFERQLEARGGSPLVSPRLFAERAFAVGISLVIVAFTGVYSLFLILSLTFQQGFGLSAIGGALVYTPLAVAFFITSLLAGRLASRWGGRLLLAGSLVAGAGFVATVVTASALGGKLTYGELLPSLVVVGAGNGLWLTQLMNAVLARIRPSEIGMASGVLSTSQQVGGAIGVAVLGVLFYHSLGRGTSISSYSHALVVTVSGNIVITVLSLVLITVLLIRVSRSAKS